MGVIMTGAVPFSFLFSHGSSFQLAFIGPQTNRIWKKLIDCSLIILGVVWCFHIAENEQFMKCQLQPPAKERLPRASGELWLLPDFIIISHTFPYPLLLILSLVSNPCCLGRVTEL